MPIAKKPIQEEEANEREIKAVIDKGGSIPKKKSNKTVEKILIRIPTELLTNVENALTTRPLKTPRNTWILEAILEKLERE
jgi:hypothetical protein